MNEGEQKGVKFKRKILEPYSAGMKSPKKIGGRFELKI